MQRAPHSSRGARLCALAPTSWIALVHQMAAAPRRSGAAALVALCCAAAACAAGSAAAPSARLSPRAARVLAAIEGDPAAEDVLLGFVLPRDGGGGRSGGAFGGGGGVELPAVQRVLASARFRDAAYARHLAAAEAALNSGRLAEAARA
jgi:tetratricopeptide (TPR) repeat protein